MNSKERIIRALRRKEVDYVPCVPMFWDGFRQKWPTEEERLNATINELGVDAVITFHCPPEASHSQEYPAPYYSKEIAEKVWVEHSSREKNPLLHKEIETPKGKLSAVIQKTDDYPYKDILLISDFNTSRFVKPWVETMEDVEKLAYIFLPLGAGTLKKERFQKTHKLAEKYQVPLIGFAGKSLNGAVHLMGAQNALIISMDKPQIIDRLLEIVHSTYHKTLETLLSWGVKIFIRNGWYDTTDFWSPDQFKKWVMPQLKKDIELVHSKGGVFIYQCCTGIMPLIPLFKELDFDCLLEPEPILGHLDMRMLKKELGDRKSFWGGISAPIHIGEGTPEKVREAVREAFNAFGKRGFILKAVPSIRPQWPWENTLAMIDEWKRLR